MATFGSIVIQSTTFVLSFNPAAHTCGRYQAYNTVENRQNLVDFNAFTISVPVEALNLEMKSDRGGVLSTDIFVTSSFSHSSGKFFCHIKQCVSWR